jgi:hypothetical protein
MPNHMRAQTLFRDTALRVALVGAACITTPWRVEAQKSHQATVQIEVSDSIGLPLPDAKVEVFTFMEGGVFWEWVSMDSTGLGEGINLLRFSYPGYRSSTFSVPIRDGTTLSLRIRLDPEHDTTKANKVVEARPVRAIGLVTEGRAHTDIIGRRRILEHGTFEHEAVSRFGPLMRRARNTELTVIPATGGTFRVFSEAAGGMGRCPLQVMVNGDRRRVLPFENFDQLFSLDEAEAIEIFPMGSSVPLSYQVPRQGCGLMVVWFRLL